MLGAHLPRGSAGVIVVALELEVEEYVSKMRHLRDEDGHALVVRNGYAQERTVTPGAGPVKVSAPRVHDRRDEHRFGSRILPPYMRRSP
ncbi:MAG: IS256 family transposase, partial [Anaerolineae bacterium]